LREKIMEIEIISELFRVPELDSADQGELGFSVQYSVAAGAAADNAHWKQRLAGGGMSAVAPFASWRNEQLTVSMGQPGSVPFAAQILQTKTTPDDFREALVAALESYVLRRIAEPGASFALGPDAGVADGQTGESGEVYNWPRFLSGLAVQTAPINREVYGTNLLLRVRATDVDLTAPLFAVVGFRQGALAVPLPATAGNSANDEEGFDSGIDFDGARIRQRALHLLQPGAVGTGWVQAASIEDWSLLDKQMNDELPVAMPSAHPLHLGIERGGGDQEQLAGAVLFVRSYLPGNAGNTPWRCLNACIAGVGDATLETVSPSPLISFQDIREFRDEQGQVSWKPVTLSGTEIRYDSASMFGSAAGAEARLIEGADTANFDALLTLSDSKNPWSYEPPLGFGMQVEMAACLIGNGGVLPPGLQDATDPTKLVAFDENWTPPSTATQAKTIISKSYRRRVAVGPCLLDSELATLPGRAPPAETDPLVLAERAESAMAEIDTALLPLPVAAHMSDPQPAAIVVQHALMLRVGPDSTADTTRELMLRAPGVEYRTLDRWLLADWKAADEPGQQRLAGALDGYRDAQSKLANIDLEALGADQRANLRFEDPAVDRIFLHMSDSVDGPVESLEFPLNHPGLHSQTPGPILSAQCRNSWGRGIRLRLSIGAQTRMLMTAGGADDELIVDVEVRLDALVALSIFVGVDRSLWSNRFHPDLQDRFTPVGAGVTHWWLSPRVLRIETASERMPGSLPVTTAAAPQGGRSAELYRALSVAQDGRDLQLLYRPPADLTAKNVRRFDVGAQHWRWDGRSVDSLPRTQGDLNAPPQASSNAARNAILWESVQYLERAGRAAAEVPRAVPYRRADAAFPMHRESVAGDGEQFVRFSVRAQHRYEALFRALRQFHGMPARGDWSLLIGQDLGARVYDDYLRGRRAALPRHREVPVPGLALLLPLFEAVEPDSPSGAGDVLALLNEPWFQHGLGEHLQVEIEPVVRYLCPEGADHWPACVSVDEQPRCEQRMAITRIESGPDPVFSAEASIPSGRLPRQQIAGPFGLGFDQAIAVRRLVTTAFAISAPQPANAFEMSKLRMRRVIEPQGFVDALATAATALSTLDATQLARWQSSGQFLLDLTGATRFPSFQLTIGELTLDFTAGGVSHGANAYPTLLAEDLGDAFDGELRIALTREFADRDDGQSGPWSLRISRRKIKGESAASDAAEYTPWQAILSLELAQPARPDALKLQFSQIPASTQTLVLDPRHSRWTQGRWIQFWPRRRCLSSSGKPLLENHKWTALRMHRETGGWSIVEGDGPAVEHGLVREMDGSMAVDGGRLFQCVLLTRRVRAAAGTRPGEIFLSILVPSAASPSLLELHPDTLAIADTVPVDEIQARILLLQRKPGRSAAGSLWERLFPSAQDADADLRILGISPALGDAD